MIRIVKCVRCLGCSLVECPPETQAVGDWFLAETFLSRDALLKDGENSEPVFLNVYGAQKSIPRNEFRQAT